MSSLQSPSYFSPLSPDEELAFAFEELNFEKVQTLINEGGDPNLSIHLTLPIIRKYLEVQESLFEGSVDLKTEEEMKSFLDQFFKEDALHPIVFVAAILKEEGLAELLLDRGAHTTIELADSDCSKINILQVACALNCLDLAKFAILNNQIPINKPAVEGDSSPLAIAIMSGKPQMVELLLELKSDQADASIYQDEYVKQFLELSDQASKIRELLERYGIEE